MKNERERNKNKGCMWIRGWLDILSQRTSMLNLRHGIYQIDLDVGYN